MPAPNLPTLFDFEGQFERAAQEILAGVLIDAYVTGQDDRVPEMKTLIAFDLGPADADKMAKLEKPASWPEVDAQGNRLGPPKEYFIYSATLEYRVEVPRDDRQPTIAGVNSMLSQICGMLRAEMMQCVRPFTEANLPYYKVARIRPDGTSVQPGPPEKNTDIVFMRYALRFEIRPDAWPAWVEA